MDITLSKGFGFTPHPKSLDAVIVELTQLGAVRIYRTVDDPELADDQLVWWFDPDRRIAGFAKLNERWEYELLICSCENRTCTGIRKWTCKVHGDDEGDATDLTAGLFSEGQGASWQGTSFAIEEARKLSALLEGEG